jgi:hypothetical protein
MLIKKQIIIFSLSGGLSAFSPNGLAMGARYGGESSDVDCSKGAARKFSIFEHDSSINEEKNPLVENAKDVAQKENIGNGSILKALTRRTEIIQEQKELATKEFHNNAERVSSFSLTIRTSILLSFTILLGKI